jgi:hypothetical protein
MTSTIFSTEMIEEVVLVSELSIMISGKSSMGCPIVRILLDDGKNVGIEMWIKGNKMLAVAANRRKNRLN